MTGYRRFEDPGTC